MLRIIAILLMCFIIVSLVWALISMMRDRSSTTKTVRALTMRVGLSLLLFILILVAAAFDVFPG